MKTIFTRKFAPIAAITLMPLVASESFGQLVVTTIGDTTTVKIDFEELDANDILTNQYSFFGIDFSYATKGGVDSNATDIRIFDTFNVTGGDDDLETPGSGPGNSQDNWNNLGYIFSTPIDINNNGAGKVAIIQEPGESDPDDWAVGGTLRISFQMDVTFEAFGILDQDDGNDSFANFYKADSSSAGAQIDIMDDGDNSYQEFVGFDYEDVRQADITFESSGALSGVQFSFDNTEFQIPEPSTYGLIGAGSLGVLIIARRIRQKRKPKAA